MCIIAIKERYARFPSEDRVRTMCRNNPDGFALAYHTDEEGVRIYRTMDRAKFIDEYKRIVETHNPEETSMFIHARISTHGSNKLENCHGWKDDNAGICFAHNGILSIDNRDDMTDSETFFRDIFLPIFYSQGWYGAEKAIDAIIGTSKFVFLDTLGRIIHYGHYTEDYEDNVLYSNTTYMDYGSFRYNDWCYQSRRGGTSKKGKENGKTSQSSEDIDRYNCWDCDDAWPDYGNNLSEFEKQLLDGYIYNKDLPF